MLFTNVNENGKTEFITAIFFAVLATFAVALRLYARTLSKARYGWDDWYIVVALICFYGYLADTTWGMFKGGGGRDVTSLFHKKQLAAVYLKSLVIAVPLYALAATVVKVSILCLYRRIFPTRTFKRIILAVGLILMAFFFASVFVGIFICVPVEKFWNPTMPGHCNNFDVEYLVLEIIEVLVDVVLLVLPIHMVSTLQLSRQNKIILSMIFLLGGTVVLTAILRIALVYRPNSSYVSLTHVEVWTNVHLGIAITCACFPTYRPLLSKFVALGSTLRQRYTSLLGSSNSVLGFKRSRGTKNKGYDTSNYDNKPGSQYFELDNRHGDKTHLTEAAGAPILGKHIHRNENPVNSITVRSEVDIV